MSKAKSLWAIDIIVWIAIVGAVQPNSSANAADLQRPHVHPASVAEVQAPVANPAPQLQAEAPRHLEILVHLLVAIVLALVSFAAAKRWLPHETRDALEAMTHGVLALLLVFLILF